MWVTRSRWGRGVNGQIRIGLWSNKMLNEYGYELDIDGYKYGYKHKFG